MLPLNELRLWIQFKQWDLLSVICCSLYRKHTYMWVERILNCFPPYLTNVLVAVKKTVKWYSRIQPDSPIVVIHNKHISVFFFFSSIVLNLHTNRCVRTIGKVRIINIFKYYEIQFFLFKSVTKFLIYTQQYDCMLGF